MPSSKSGCAGLHQKADLRLIYRNLKLLLLIHRAAAVVLGESFTGLCAAPEVRERVGHLVKHLPLELAVKVLWNFHQIALRTFLF